MVQGRQRPRGVTSGRKGSPFCSGMYSLMLTAVTPKLCSYSFLFSLILTLLCTSHLHTSLISLMKLWLCSSLETQQMLRWTYPNSVWMWLSSFLVLNELFSVCC